MELREAVPADAESIAHLHAESWRTAYRGMYSDEYLDGDVAADRTKVWKQRFASPDDSQYVLLATEGDGLVGFVCAYGNRDERWGTLVDNLHVLPGHQRQGLGRRLLATSAIWSRERYPGALFHLWVLDGNANAQRFYEGLGAEPQESEVHEPPGGGSVTVWRYVWQGRALDALTNHAAD
jgi:GNAT superfamily N-acetyltransferase